MPVVALEFWTLVTTAAWFTMAVVCALAFLYKGPLSRLVYENGQLSWWKQFLVLVLCFGASARMLFVLRENSSTWDGVVISVILTGYAVNRWHHYVNKKTVTR